MPKVAKWWNVGFIQLWMAAKNAKRFKQCILYMFAYFMLQESESTASHTNSRDPRADRRQHTARGSLSPECCRTIKWAIVTVLISQGHQYSPVILNLMTVVGDFSGGSGNLFMFLLQRKFRFSNKAGVLWGAAMTLLPYVVAKVT